METDAVLTSPYYNLTTGGDTICHPLGMSPESDVTDTPWWPVAAFYIILTVQQMEAEQEWKMHSVTTPAAEGLAPNLTG